MAEPKSYEPEKTTAGVTWTWKKTLTDYPASEWSLVYYLRRNGQTLTSFSGTADGDSFLVTVTAATTAPYTAGTYDFIGWVTKGTEKHEVFNSTLKVLPNPTNSSAYDPRSHSQKVLDLIEAAMEGRAETGIESYSIGGRSINKIPLQELRKLYEKYADDVRREKQAERLLNGRRSGKHIGIRFSQIGGNTIQRYTVG